MKKQIKRLSPHQNAKVFAILMTAAALCIFIPMALVMSFVVPPTDQNGNPVAFPFMFFVIMPLFYLVFGYIFTAIGCAVYNLFYRFIGGIEFVTEDKGE
jgi:hypothetical protein